MRTTITGSASVLVFVLAVGSSFSVFAQDTNTDSHQITVEVPTVALLDLEIATGSVNFTAEFTQAIPFEAGQKLTAPADNATLWLNYSSIQTKSTPKHVDVSASSVVPGINVHVVAGASATGFGAKGTPTAGFNLTTTDQSLITGIGSAYTASGANNGHLLTYSFTALDANYANLRSGSTTIDVTYTLADN